jgi:hypothetical protein
LPGWFITSLISFYQMGKKAYTDLRILALTGLLNS